MSTSATWLAALASCCLLLGAGALRAARRRPPVTLPATAAPPAAASAVKPPALVVSTLAGELPGPEWHDGQGTAAIFQGPFGVAADAHGNVYVADGRAVRKITPTGLVTTLAGEPPAPRVYHNGHLTRVEPEDYAPRDGTGTAARFTRIVNICAAPDGTVFVSDEGANSIRRISPQGVVTTLAGKDKGFRQFGDPAYADGPGSEALFSRPGGLVVDAQGNVLVADIDNHVIRKITPAGRVSTYAGQASHSGGYADGPAAQARFAYPLALALAPDGALFVYENNNHTIRRISPQGVVSTWGGHPSNTPRGPGPAAALDFDYHRGLAIDPAGVLYVIHRRHAIRRLRLADGAELSDIGAPEGPNGAEGGRGYVDAPTPAAARFNFPENLAAGPDGTLYVADLQNHVVRKISPQGVVSTLAGQSRDVRFGPQPPDTGLGLPSGLARDRAGNLYVADRGNAVVRRISPAGAISVWAGQLGQPGTADGPAAQARFNQPADVAIGPDGRTLYVADAGSHTLRQIGPDGVVSTLAGVPGQAGERNGAARRALLNEPSSLAVAPDGTVYLIDGPSGSVRCLTPGGRVSTFVAGFHQGYVGPLSNAPRLVAGVSTVAVGPDGAVYVLNGVLTKYSPAGRGKLLAGDPNPDTSGGGFADGPARQARFNEPLGMAVTPQGEVLVADAANHLIRRVSPQGVVSTLAGDVRYETRERGYGPDGHGPSNRYGMATYFGGYADGPAAQTRFNNPSALVLAPDGTLYVTDTGNGCIRVVRPVE